MKGKEIRNKGLIGEALKGRAVAFLAGCVVGEELYFASWLTNGLYKMELKTGKCIPLKIFKYEMGGRHLYGQMIFFNNSLWLMPTHMGRNIVKVDLDTLETEYFSLPDKGMKQWKNAKSVLRQYKCCHKAGKSICWLVPLDGSMMLKVDMLEGQIVEVRDSDDIVEFRDSANFIDAELAGEKIWFCPYGNNDLVIFDTVREKFHVRKWQHEKEKFGLITSYKEWVVFLSKGAGESILMVNQNTYEEKKIYLYLDWEEKTTLMYTTVHVVGRYLFLAPFRAHEYVIVDLESGRIQVDRSLMECKSGRYQSGISWGSKIIYASDMPGYPLMIHDLQENVVSFMNFWVDGMKNQDFLEHLYQDDPEGFLDWLCQKEGSFQEDDLPLSLYCILVKKRECAVEFSSGRENGRRIFRHIKGQD